jgi:peptide/nickel transport system substrate-binding protein
MRAPRRPHRAAVAAAGAVAVLASACSAAAPAAREQSGPLQVAGQFEVHSLDPATAGGTFTRLQVAETLVDADSDGVLQPGLASSWQASADQRTWTFDLAPEAMFHDGTPVTAGQVVASLDKARGTEGTPLTEIPWRSVSADGQALRIELSEAFASLPAVLAHTSAQVLAASSYAADGSVKQVVGSGPYRVERVQIPSAVDLVAAEQWRGNAPAIQRIAYQVVGRAEARALSAESGQVDITFGMDPTSLTRLKGKRGLKIESATVPRTILLKANAEHPALEDVRVRRAISLALDREAMAKALLRDPEMAAAQLFPPTLDEWHQDDLAPLTHDLAEAGDLLTQAKWTLGPDGIRTRDSEQLALTLRTYPDRAELPVIATAVQAALAKVGIAVEVAVGNSSEISAGHEDGTLELGLYARNFSLVPDPLVTLLGDFDADGAEYGALGWNDPRLTSRLEDMADGIDGAGGEAARAQVAQILQEELPVIPIAWYRQSAVVSDSVEGVVLDPLERSFRLADARWAP